MKYYIFIKMVCSIPNDKDMSPLMARKSSVKGLKSIESTITSNHLEETFSIFIHGFLGEACDRSCSKIVST